MANNSKVPKKRKNSNKISTVPSLRRKAPRVTSEMAVMFHRFKKAGMKQQDIAALYSVNQARVSEVVNGHKFPDILDQASLF
jgi:hypothetical protein